MGNGLPAWQVHLGPADIDPHIGQPDGHGRVACQAKSDDIELCCNLLVRDRQIDMFQTGNFSKFGCHHVRAFCRGSKLSI